jgi:hypothetical protein
LSADDDPRSALHAIGARFGLGLTWLDEMTEAVLCGLLHELPAGPASQSATKFWTEHGGVLLLMQLIMRLGWPASWREALADVEARTLAFAISVYALAPERTGHMANDEALLRALDVSDVRRFLARRRRSCETALREIAADAQSVVQARRRDALFGGRLGAALHCAGKKLLAELGTRLPGLAGSSPDYLRRNLLTLPAAIDTHAAGARVRFGRAPLDVLLTLAGWKRGRCELPGGRMIELGGDVPP